MKFKNIIFDLDGVLIDSKSNMNKSWSNTSRKYNLNIKFNKYEKFVGLPFRKILSELNIKKNLSDIEKYYAAQSLKNINKIKLYAYVKTILKEINKKKINYAIVTSKDKKRSLKILKLFNLFPKSIHCPQKKQRGKPYPDQINACMKMHKFKKKDTCYVGDMYVDYVASKRAGISFVYAGYGFGISSSNYKYKIKTFKDFRKFI